MVGLERGTVELAADDGAWADRYEAEVERLRAVTDGRLDEFEHVGSTAVPGLPAKPVLDVLAAVDDLDAADDLAPVLEANGYEQRPDEGVAGRLFFARGPPGNRTVYLSLAEPGSAVYRETVAFRDHLREHPDVAEAYAALKRRLAAAHPDDRAAYTAGKSAFVERVLDRVLDR
jgi:GrpB-like predicted nucleotidyltransferase (UPF0157 family)